MEPLVVAPKAETEDAPREERREERSERGGERRREDRSEGRAEVRSERRDDRREPREERREPREDRRDDRRDYRRDRDLGPSVIGMGDHVPDFILRSFAIKPAKSDELEETATGVES
jgi:hypothetical protein